MATIRVDPERVLGTVDRRIFGGFIEHLGRCIYGGVFEPGSPLSDGRGFRRDVLEALRPLGVPVLRWPGGNFVSGYHWEDGIGPIEARPRRLEIAWHAEEPNTFGTDEFIAYCRELGAEPYICLNMGTGTLDEARAWVEYCNGTTNTHWANRRRAHGHPEPYGVRYWGLGNEMYGEWQIGHLTADDYVTEARRWVNTLRMTDPSIQLISCGRDGTSDWDRTVIDGLVRYVDMHSIHIYTGSHDHWDNVLAPLRAERALRICSALIERARLVQRVEREVRIAYDEWNVWFRERRGGLEERYTLSDAVAVGTYLNVFVRQCRTLGMANLAQMVNAIAPIVTAPDGLLRQSIYHPLRLGAEHVQEVALDALVLCEAQDGHPVLDAAATRDAAGSSVVVTVANRDPAREVPVRLEVGRKLSDVAAHHVVGESPQALNTFERPDAVTVRSGRATLADAAAEVTLPPCSFSVIVLR